MKKNLYYILVIVFTFFYSAFLSQTPACPNGLVFMHTSPITAYNPALPYSATNPSNTAVPLGGTGLSYGPNLNAAFPSPTFYTTIGGFMAWWNGTAWVTTTHTMPFVNLGGGGGVIYGLNGSTGQIYVYNGTGNATPLTTITNFNGGGPYDLVVDNCGNFYVLITTTPQSMAMYGPNGALQCTYNMTGMPSISAGGGFAIVNGQVVVSNTGGIYTGNINGTTISFTNTSTNSYGAGDFANCPLPCGPLSVTAANTTTSIPLGCNSGTANVVATTSSSPVTYNWAGPGIVSGATSSLAVVNVPGVYTVTVIKSGCPSQTITATTTVVGTTTFVATIAASGSITCTNSTIQLTASPGPAGHTYLWTGPGIVGANNTQVINVNQPGVYTTTVTNTTSGCKGIATINVVANLTPPALVVGPPTSSICSGNSANISVSGANSYVWSPATGLNTTTGPNVVANPVVTTTYNIIGTVGTCTNSSTAVVVINPQPAISANITDANCGNANGVIVINNISPPVQTVVSFSLNGVAIPSQTITGLAAGSYTLGVSNNFGCKTFITVTVNNTPGITALASTFINPTCGNSNGSISLGVVTGGSGPYQYSFNGGPFSATTLYTNLPAGTYTITVKDVNNCLFTKTVTLTNIPGPTNLTFTTAPTACVGNTGILGITGVTGGSPAYSFSVNGVGTSSVTNNLAAGPKTITVSDVNGCTFSITANIPTVAGPTAATVAATSAACGNANGSATVTGVTGGLPAYQYSFNGGPFVGSAIQSGMLAGPKNVVIKDANGCTLTVNFVIGNTGSPSSAISTLSNVSCFNGNNGSFSISTSGGTPGYSYTLTPGNITNGFGNFTNLTAQNYTVNVQDALGCVTTITTSISQPSALTLSVTSLQPSCNGGNNGTITATAGGGTGPYVYNINGGPNQASNIFITNISAGAYNITVIDNKGCTLSQTVSVTQPLPITLTLSSVPANCSSSNGSASVSASGGTPVYTYTWLPVGGNNPQTTGVAAGSYTVTVKDSKGCIQTGIVSVTATPGGTAVITNTTNVSCFNSANGSLTANMVGNVTAPLTYSWSNGSTLQTATGLAPGNYTVTVSDFYGCKSSTVGTITQPGNIILVSGSSAALCFNSATGSATTIVSSGGTPGFSYLWSPGGATTSVVSGLLAGTYTCQVTDANGCIKTNTVSITQPSSVTINTSTLTATCNQANGVASATAIGGTGPYTYTWSTNFVGQTLSNVAAGTYTVLVKDANGCLYTLAATVPNASGPAIAVTSFTNPSCFGGNNGIATTTINPGNPGPGFPIYTWSNGQNTGTATNLMNGVYTVTLTDATGCIASASVTITQPPALTLNVTGTNPKCFNATNGTANAGVLGGTPAYTYAWLPAPGAGGNSATPSGMGPGNYGVTVTDSKGCIIQGSVALANPPQMLSGVSSTNVSCFNACNGLAVASVTNAVGAVSYYWTGGPVPLTTQNVSNLCVGTFSMMATDQNSCTSTTVFNITQPPLLTVSISAIGTPSCSGYSNGFATASPNGGTPAYTYSWSNSQSNATANNLIAGSYTITVSDSKSCTATAVANVTQPAGLSVTVTHTNISCFGLNNGIGNVNYSGGTGIPVILWQPSLANTQYVNTLAPGNHTVTLTDANNCTVQSTFSLTQPSQLVANITTVVPTNCGQANGSSSVAASGGAGGYTYQWTSNPSFTSPSIINVVSGAYSVTITDANGCTATTATVIPNIAAPVVVVTNTFAVSCFGMANGGATITATGGAGSNNYLWSYLAQTTQNVNNLPSGLHSITVTDAAGCVGGAVVNITQPTQLVTAIGSVTNVACSGQFNGAAQMLTNGGTPNYSYLWLPTSQTNSVLTGVGTGVYSCTVTDANGCVSSKTVNISQPNPLLITTNTVIPNNCNGFATGQINTSITGGTPTYTLTWTPAQPANPTITNLIAGTYSLAIIDTKGCTTNSVYTLTDPPAMVIQTTLATQATCGNSNGTASVNITGGTPNYSYNWNTPTPQLSPGASNLPPGNWVLTTTDAKGCVITATIPVTAAPLATVTAASTNILCNNQSNGSATITANGVNNFSYNWSPSGLTSAIVNGLGAAVHSATITDGNGCKSYTTVVISEPSVLTLNTSTPQIICYGAFAQLFGQASGGTVPYTYTLTDLSSNTSTSTTTPNGINATPTLSSTTQYTVSVLDANGCAAGPYTILVNVRPRLLASGNTYTVCDKEKVVLTPNITLAGNGGPYFYSWSNLSTASSITVTANYANNPNTYSVNVEDNCTVPGSTALFNIVVNPLPQFSFTPSGAAGCAPLAVTFTGTSTSPHYDPTSDLFYWNFGGDQNGGGPVPGNPMSMTYPNPGSYTMQVMVTNSFGCRKDSITNKIITVYPVPVAGFFANPQSTDLLSPTISFTNTSMGASIYSWDFGDYGAQNNSSSMVNPSHVYSLVGNYKVYLAATNAFGCSDTAENFIDITPAMTIYIPNAFTPDENGRNDVFMPYGVGISEEKYRMEIFDRWGESIFTSTELKKGWDGRAKGSTIMSQDGVYIYKITVMDYENNKKTYVGHVTLLKQ